MTKENLTIRISPGRRMVLQKLADIWTDGNKSDMIGRALQAFENDPQNFDKKTTSKIIYCAQLYGMTAAEVIFCALEEFQTNHPKQFGQ